VWERLGEASRAAGFGNAVVGLVLGALGLRALARLDRSRVATSVVFLVGELLLLGLLQRFPFLDNRTSHFLLVTFVVIAAVGVVHHIFELTAHSPASFAALTLVFSIIVATAWPNIRAHSIPDEDVRSQIRYVEAEWLPGDVLLANQSGSFGVGYYLRAGSPAFVDSENLATGWMPRFDRQDIVFAKSRTEVGIANALDQALAQVGANRGRLWIIRSHVVPFEAEFWHRVLTDRGLEPQLVAVGSEPLGVIEPNPRKAR
ncbi:MAG: hypothetical protein ACRDZM_02060, partial [Acidimicrobiia bacterium]